MLLLNIHVAIAKPLLQISSDHPVTVCPFVNTTLSPSTFTHRQCETKSLLEVDPQNRAMWLLLEFDKNAAWQKIEPPYAFFMFGKVASSAYLNNTLIGHNGQPSDSKNETPGKMDTSFYLPESLLLEKQNQLALLISSQHSMISLDYPIHYLGFGQFTYANRYVQQGSFFGLILFGAFTVGALYFLVLSFGHQKPSTARLFCALCIIAAAQLLFEMTRGLFAYNYPFHDIRLLAITALSFLFGHVALTYCAYTILQRRAIHWVYISVLVSVIAMLLLPGFDTKITAAILIPLIVSLNLILWAWFKTREPRLLQWFVVQLVITITIVVSVARFHELIHFIIIGLFLGYLFILEAKEAKKALQQQQQDQALIAKLESTLSQRSHAAKPQKLLLQSAGQQSYVSIPDIIYCQAAGDYVELFLKGNETKLYSGSLKQLEEKLPSFFLKVHRSYIVNLNEVITLKTNHGGANKGYQLQLSHDYASPVSRRLLSTVKDTLKQTNN